MFGCVNSVKSSVEHLPPPTVIDHGAGKGQFGAKLREAVSNVTIVGIEPDRLDSNGWPYKYPIFCLFSSDDYVPGSHRRIRL